MKELREFAHVKNENGEIIGFFVGPLTERMKKGVESIRYVDVDQFNEMVRQEKIQFFQFDESKNSVKVQYTEEECQFCSKSGFPSIPGELYFSNDIFFTKKEVNLFEENGILISLGYLIDPLPAGKSDPFCSALAIGSHESLCKLRKMERLLPIVENFTVFDNVASILARVSKLDKMFTKLTEEGISLSVNMNLILYVDSEVYKALSKKGMPIPTCESLKKLEPLVKYCGLNKTFWENNIFLCKSSSANIYAGAELLFFNKRCRVKDLRMQKGTEYAHLEFETKDGVKEGTDGWYALHQLTNNINVQNVVAGENAVIESLNSF